jgi:hypothetical protein
MQLNDLMMKNIQNEQRPVKKKNNDLLGKIMK